MSAADDASRDITEAVARCLVRLEELSDFMRGQIKDVGAYSEEYLALNRHINSVELAMAILSALEEQRAAVQRSVKKLVSQ
jgi:Ser/Thr protein kinase RdoA (MazF antagonist)